MLKILHVRGRLFPVCLLVSMYEKAVEKIKHEKKILMEDVENTFCIFDSAPLFDLICIHSEKSGKNEDTSAIVYTSVFYDS